MNHQLCVWLLWRDADIHCPERLKCSVILWNIITFTVRIGREFVRHSYFLDNVSGFGDPLTFHFTVTQTWWWHSSEWNVLTTTGLITMEFRTHIFVPLRIFPQIFIKHHYQVQMLIHIQVTLTGFSVLADHCFQWLKWQTSQAEDNISCKM